MLASEEWRHEALVRFGTASGATGKTKNGAIERGNAYHRKVFKVLDSNLSLNAPDLQRLTEPWLRSNPSQRLCSPDYVIIDRGAGIGLVVEVKKNWKDGRDQKLLDLYLPAVRSAFGLTVTKPAVIVGNARGLAYPAWPGLSRLFDALSWRPGDPTPVLLVP